MEIKERDRIMRYKQRTLDLLESRIELLEKTSELNAKEIAWCQDQIQMTNEELGILQDLDEAR